MDSGGDEVGFGRFTGPLDYPMYVLTVPGSGGGRPSGCMVGFATQCSLSPPRFLVCLSKLNHTYRVARGAGVAAVHVLGAADRDLAELFGAETGDEIDKFERCAWRKGPEGVPLLDRCPGWLVGSIESRVDLGDHEGLLLRPIDTGPGEDGGVLMFSAVTDLDAGHPA
jgi:flavin reductase (DIM6/NTAB) family NADH-FMN oxidoreductase RutF